DPKAREAVGVQQGERIIATIAVGEPAAVTDAKPRGSADQFTTWVP
ncbi:MAG TPA: nitroreductase, partial [Gemmatimonadetes bacterium]|nr:nitroreductase [Gemmatimonadota bacterium]